MLVNWGRLLILLQCAAMLSTASISIWFCCATVRQGDTAMPDRLHARLFHAFLVQYKAVYFTKMNG